MIGLLNLGSLILGLISWILPLIILFRYQKRGSYKNWVVLTMISISACAISLCFQIFNNYYLVKMEDFSALIDITGAVTTASAVLLIVTIILNAITLIAYRYRTAK
ncbi:hypothetical protein [Oceanobacillus saliphilus]|uniref:hypothetical protein n=1 Tax=Oceanobacillus saliphilus TaxID=2925834 RepID=UPI00201DBB5B|nr:hypothetical protein [Oceanobacillus saliphilus]